MSHVKTNKHIVICTEGNLHETIETSCYQACGSYTLTYQNNAFSQKAQREPKINDKNAS